MKNTFKDIAQLLHQKNPQVSFAVEFWDGDRISYGDLPEVTLRFQNKSALRRILRKGFLGFGEAYMNHELDVTGDLVILLKMGISTDFHNYRLSWLETCRFILVRLVRLSTFYRAPKNISHHYDLGNRFYSLYLDETLTYSCAYFKSPEESLEQAQINKYDHVSRKLFLKPGDSLLDIGCGWGGMLIHAAGKYGVTGVGITLSRNQYKYGTEKIKELGLEDRIKILYQDYRYLSGSFDKVVSIGMFEHVGKKYIPLFINNMAGVLKKAGMGLLHTIGKDIPTPTDAWTYKYIFPGGYLPTLEEIIHYMGKTGLTVLDVENLRRHYAMTLERWSEKYERNLEKIREMFDDSFVRRWRLFLLSSMAGFRYGDVRLYQILFSKGLNQDYPLTRDHLYRAGLI